MKKSFILRSLQVVVAVSLYSAIYIWAANSHSGSVFSILNGLDEFLLVLALAVIFPYVCFKGLNKLTTKPESLDSESAKSAAQEAEEDIDLKTMQYRGTTYFRDRLDSLENLEGELEKARQSRFNTVTKYRGVEISDPDEQSAPDDESAIASSFVEDRQQQKSAKPKERIRYRGAYID